MGCSSSLIVKIESDGRRPSRQMVELLATHLEIPSDQRSLFMQVARQEKSVEHLESLKSINKSGSAPVSQAFITNLPLPLTPLIGREHELRAILLKIQDPCF